MTKPTIETRYPDDSEMAKRFMAPRSVWGEGPWQHEPDRVEWKTKAGLPALVRRVPMGMFCGYVAVPPGHPAHGKDTGAIDVEAHGGINSTGPCDGEVCHVPEPGEPDDVWWIGFDCGHSYDLAPAMAAVYRRDLPPDLQKNLGSLFGPDVVYRSVDYVIAECEQLAAQLAAMATKATP